MESFGDGYEKTNLPLILNFANIKKLELYDKTHSCGIELTTFDCIIHNDKNSSYPAMSKSNMDWWNHLKNNKYFMPKYGFVILTSIITTTIKTNATEKGPHNGIEIPDFGVYKNWQISMYNITIDCILVAG